MNIDLSKLTPEQKLSLYRQLGIELKDTIEDNDEY
jgi:hypothetical protein